MNRALRNHQMKRCMYRKHGGGAYSTAGGPLMDVPANDWTYAAKESIRMPIDECAAPERPGAIELQMDPSLAQVAMAGGRRRRMTQRRRGGGCGECMLSGGRRRRQSMRGGSRAFAVDPAMSVGGEGPNVGAVISGVPCEMSDNPFNPFAAVQLGGAAPNSNLPVYNATTAGFRFEPSTAAGATLPDGVTAFNVVVPYDARGGRRRRRTHRARKSKRATRRQRM